MIVAKIYKGDPTRRSRFHTRRGELLPRRSWIEIPRSVISRLKGNTGNLAPWMTPAAITYLAEAIQRDWQVFEYSSGLSTAWYAKNAGYVVSVESNEDWHSKTAKSLSDAGVSNSDLMLVNDNYEKFMNYISEYADGIFDLVIVDFTESTLGDRVRCLELAQGKVKRDGLLVLDDSDREQYRHAEQILDGWEAMRFPGVKPVPLAAVETTVFRRLK